MKIIGLTGGLASGKSTVSQMLRDEGMAVIDADVLAREVVQPGSFGLSALVQVFGPSILQGNQLNRTLLRDKVFFDQESRFLVESITHPLIQWRARQEFKNLLSQRVKTAVYDAALIFEKNLVHQFDQIIVVHLPLDIQLKRLISRDGITEDVARQRLKTQWPLEKKVSQAHHLVDNSGSREETRKQVANLAKNFRN